MVTPVHLFQNTLRTRNAGCTRIGEADHPGPADPTTFALGCANANNLLTKADIIRQLPRGIWGFSETCLTKGGVEQFQKP